jgi:hypothetical protein
MKRLNLLLSALVLVSATAGIVRAEPAPSPGPTSCRDVPAPFVAPIPKPHRADALRLLSSKEVLTLTDQQAAMLLGEPVGTTSFALERLDAAISELKVQRQAELEHQEGSWSIADSEKLADLVRLRSRVSERPPQPFLLRATMGFEGTGTFLAQQCDSSLYVIHGSLGRSSPQPQSVPVIVLLSQTPLRIHSEISVAE